MILPAEREGVRFCLVVLVLAAPKPPIQAQIEGRYKLLNRAFARLDASAVGSWLAKNAGRDFFYRPFTSAPVDSKQLVQVLKHEFSTIWEATRADYRLSNFVLAPEHASCTVTGHYVFLQSSGRKIVDDFTRVDRWTHGKDGWRVQSMVVTKESLR